MADGIKVTLNYTELLILDEVLTHAQIDDLFSRDIDIEIFKSICKKLDLEDISSLEKL